MSSLNDPGMTGQQYWRSLEHLAETDAFREFMHREFPAGASELLDAGDRRHFLKIMGASLALAGLGLSGCRRWPEEEIVPFAHRPENRDPGVPVQFATSMDLGGVSMGLLAASFDGRPVKLEGNPEHPSSLGATDVYAQASVLDLYDPDRSRTVMKGRGEAQAPSSLQAFAQWARPHFDELRNNGSRLAVLSEANSSPSLDRLKRRLLRDFSGAEWYEYEPIFNDDEVRGTELAFGAPHRVHLKTDEAKVFVSFDGDFIGCDRESVRNMRGFAKTRRIESPQQGMSRLYVFESAHSITGASADERVAMRSADIAVAAAWLAARILGESSLERIETADGADAVLTTEVKLQLEHVLDDLRDHRGEGLLVAGRSQPAEVHLLVHLMNDALGNVGRTVTYTRQADQPKHLESIRTLAQRIDAGEIDTLLIVGGNPVYNAPADLDFPVLLSKVTNTIHLSEYNDETSSSCDWHVHRAHYLESWGDGRAWDGTYTTCQPLIEPLWNGLSAIELLAVILGDDATDGQSIVKTTFAEMTGGADDGRWRTVLHDGVLKGSAYTPVRPQPRRENLSSIANVLLDRLSATSEGWELVFTQHPTVFDGRFANNGWLQELPDPMAKLTWDNAVIVSPNGAQRLGVGEMAKNANGAMVTVTVGGRTVEAPVLVLPGVNDHTAVLTLGYGRRFKGRICADAGFDFYPLRTTDAAGFVTGASIAKTSGTYTLACTQDHHTIDVETVGGRGAQKRLPTLVREADLNEYRKHPKFAKHRTHVVHRLSLFEEDHPFQREGEERKGDYAWAMSIDLNSCTGCSACVVACQAENNIPIVGKEQVHRGREMHWIRLDRYFKFGRTADGDYEPTKIEGVALQPVPCMHCENAPCEQVCPVAATVHDDEGLNVMVYNRCIGTRYCSNNCPYKVRRFNYLDYHRRPPHREKGMLHVEPEYYSRGSATPNELKQMQFNPEVTVRLRGVMEKCTYCVQRITNAKIAAKNAFTRLPEEQKQQHEGRIPVPDGAFTTACAQACPAEAIVFGDLKDENSRISKLFRHERNYQMLEELNVDARTRYMAKVRNPYGGGSEGHAHGGGHNGHGEGHDENGGGHGEASDH